MNLGFFIMGGLIFAVYIYFTIWNIFYGARKQREENYPGYYDRHGSMNRSASLNEPDIRLVKTKSAPRKSRKKVTK